MAWRYLFREGIGANRRCLDVGCGTGILGVQLALNHAATCAAIDIDAGRSRTRSPTRSATASATASRPPPSTSTRGSRRSATRSSSPASPSADRSVPAAAPATGGWTTGAGRCSTTCSPSCRTRLRPRASRTSCSSRSSPSSTRPSCWPPRAGVRGGGLHGRSAIPPECDDSRAQVARVEQLSDAYHLGSASRARWSPTCSRSGTPGERVVSSADELGGRRLDRGYELTGRARPRASPPSRRDAGRRAAGGRRAAARSSLRGRPRRRPRWRSTASLLSRVDDGALIVEALHVRQAAAAADALDRGCGRPVALGYPVVEGELLAAGDAAASPPPRPAEPPGALGRDALGRRTSSRRSSSAAAPSASSTAIAPARRRRAGDATRWRVRRGFGDVYERAVLLRRLRTQRAGAAPGRDWADARSVELTTRRDRPRARPRDAEPAARPGRRPSRGSHDLLTRARGGGARPHGPRRVERRHRPRARRLRGHGQVPRQEHPAQDECRPTGPRRPRYYLRFSLRGEN